jgi:4a-hydroxytetrahydrobiopterin dehydratase
MTERVEVVFYTRRECGLCDKAKAVVDQVVMREELPVTVKIVDIDSDAGLRARFTNDVPVVEIAGVEAFRHRIDPDAFAAKVREAASGIDTAPEAAPLAARECVPCRGGVPPLSEEEIAKLRPQLSPEWKVVDGHHLARDYHFSDFKSALGFTNAIGAVAEAAGHHPDIGVGWGYVKVSIWTHAIDGLTESDFVLAARIDALKTS